MKKVGIVMGSASDMPVVKKAIDTLEAFGIPYEVHVYSAHRTPEQEILLKMQRIADSEL